MARQRLPRLRLRPDQERCGCCEGFGRHGVKECERCLASGKVRKGNQEAYCEEPEGRR